LVGERLEDGGWNRERINGSLWSSFASTINVLEGLLEYENATGGTPESREEYLLERKIFVVSEPAKSPTSGFWVVANESRLPRCPTLPW
jgi:hypothetical protein